MNGTTRQARQIVPLGYISGVHGVEGWVKVHSWTRPREAILKYRPWLVGKDRRAISVREGRKQGKTLVALLPDVTDRDAARQLVNSEIAVLREQLPEPDEDEYYWADLVGLEVVNRDGAAFGTVSRLIETGANDVLVVTGERERLIPFVPDLYVTRVDLESGRIEVDWDADF